METANLVLIEQFCTHSRVELSFVDSLHELGLVEMIIVDGKKYVSYDQLKGLEKMVHFHYEMNINIEGIDVIHHLLSQIQDLQLEVQNFKNRLSRFDED